MCGIAGTIRSKKKKAIEQQWLQCAAASLNKRAARQSAIYYYTKSGISTCTAFHY